MPKKPTALVKTQPAAPPALPPEIPDYMKRLAQQAKDVKSALTVGVPQIGHRGGVLTLDKQRVKDNKLAVIPLGFAWTKQYYEKEWDEGSSDTPVCFAFGMEEKGLAPINVPDKQAETCDSCPHNVFGTALRGGGKRCGDRPRLLVLLAADLKQQGEKPTEAVIKKAQHYLLQVPPTSIKGPKDPDRPHIQGLGKYMQETVGTETPNGFLQEAITEIKTEPRQNGGYFVTFEFLGQTPPEALPALAERSENAYRLLTQPFPNLKKDDAAKQDERPLKGQAKPTKGGKGRKSSEDDIPF